MLYNILFFISSIFLQRPTGNPIVDAWNRVFNPEPSSVGGTIVVTPDYVPLVMFIFGLIIFFIVVRYLINARRHPNSEEPVGILQFVVMKQGVFEAYVSKYEAPLRPSIIRALKGSKKFSKAVDEVLTLRKQKKLFFYQMYYRHVRDLLTSTVRRRRVPPLIISTAPLDDPKYAFSQSEPKFSYATFGYDYMKTTICHSSSEKIEVETTEGEEMDVWIIAPVPLIEENTEYEKSKEAEIKKEKFKVWNSDFSRGNITMQIDVLPYSDELADIASSMVSASKQVEYIDKLEQRMDTQDDELQERDQIINKQKQKINLLKLMVGQKKLIGTELPAFFGRKQDFITWIVLGALGAILMGMMTQFIPQLQGVDRNFMEILGLIIVVAIYMITRRSTKAQTQELLEEEGISPDQMET